jgi:hypothetical protein
MSRSDDRSIAQNSPAQPAKLEPEDYYFEGPNLVFTAAYHLKRGFCCGSGCRHCPYGVDGQNEKTAAGPSTSSAAADFAQDDSILG